MRSCLRSCVTCCGECFDPPPLRLSLEQPVHVRGSGDLLAAGELATLLATRASATNNGDDPLQEALEEFGVPRNTATDYRAGIVDGGVLVWVRTQDARTGAAASALRAQNGKGVGAYPGS